jgi:hypothetical protein
MKIGSKSFRPKWTFLKSIQGGRRLGADVHRRRLLQVVRVQASGIDFHETAFWPQCFAIMVIHQMSL